MIDIIIHIIFTGLVVLIGIPMSIYLLEKGMVGFVKFRLNKLPPQYLFDSGLGTYALEIFFLWFVSINILYLVPLHR
jgi:hypothetical protein